MDGRAAALATAAAAAATATLCYCAPPSAPAGPRRLVVVGTGAERDLADAHKWVGLSSILLFSLGKDGDLVQEFELPDVGVSSQV